MSVIFFKISQLNVMCERFRRQTTPYSHLNYSETFLKQKLMCSFIQNLCNQKKIKK